MNPERELEQGVPPIPRISSLWSGAGFGKAGSAQPEMMGSSGLSVSGQSIRMRSYYGKGNPDPVVNYPE
jgi:hypothetical protein